MPYRTEWQEPEVFLEHNGVTVYHTYKDDDIEQGPRTYWFVTGKHEGEDEAFDVRDLETPSRDRLYGHTESLSEAIRAILREAIDAGLIQATEED